ncbi:uncharacterized protein LOC135946434 [Cloeon dipterum]|uniref:uncharacterized protein LOC135946434 n=1 Tax=Cloeon dipterum TaxID=197152 RepID=UPI0032205967
METTFFGILLVLLVTVQASEAIYTINALNLGSCVCSTYTCGCCSHMQVDVIELNSTICTNMTYLSDDYGLSYTITLNHHTLFNETVSARNPPPFCIGMPYLKKWAEVCLRMFDLDVTRHKFHGCVEAEARLKRVRVAHYDLGCVNIGPKPTEPYKDLISVILV